MILPRRLLLCVPLIFGALVVIDCRNAEPERRYGFLARLGNDTVSLESVTRHGNTVIHDQTNMMTPGYLEKSPGLR